MKTNLTDRELYQNFLKGDLSAFDCLIDQYRTSLIYFIQSYVKNMDVAEDLAQDVFVYLLVKRESYDFQYSMKTYLFTIGKSRAINYLKKIKPLPLEEYHTPYDPNHRPIEDAFLAEERKRILYTAIQKLTQTQSTAVYLADIEELSNDEVGRALGKTRSQVKMILYRARKNLRKILKTEGICDE